MSLLPSPTGHASDHGRLIIDMNEINRSKNYVPSYAFHPFVERLLKWNHSENNSDYDKLLTMTRMTA